MREFGVLMGSNGPVPVPVSNVGLVNGGSRDSHWRESVMGNELLSTSLDPGINPVSRMSIASFADLGYTVNMDAAEPYTLPSARELAIIGADVEGPGCRTCGHEH